MGFVLLAFPVKKL